ncbi:hypothetical protein ELI24_16925 [Rhizobium ruizarguesonis]|uniref:hypothetical protein n=1 Tax=Rhizobium ruizarguesonis TaxID=2081791 RepID=UPI0010312AED|nr:hypothetical protein [Rhizobium ruizarguesonis]TAV99944.1 hypothetical protein ELI24_16925 [Rhizobium ruizarguesonis]
MPGTPTVVALWPVLLPVIIGGTLAILGGALSPLLSHFLTGRRARAERRIQQFEAMVSAVYEHGEWLEMHNRSFVFGEAIEPGPSPMNKVHSIAIIHFPELVAPVLRMSILGLEYQQWMAGAGKARVVGNVPGMSEGFKKAHTGWIKAQGDFLDVAAKYASDRKGAV